MAPGTRRACRRARRRGRRRAWVRPCTPTSPWGRRPPFLRGSKSRGRHSTKIIWARRSADAGKNGHETPATARSFGVSPPQRARNARTSPFPGVVDSSVSAIAPVVFRSRFLRLSDCRSRSRDVFSSRSDQHENFGRIAIRTSLRTRHSWNPALETLSNAYSRSRNRHSSHVHSVYDHFHNPTETRLGRRREVARGVESGACFFNGSARELRRNCNGIAAEFFNLV